MILINHPVIEGATCQTHLLHILHHAADAFCSVMASAVAHVWRGRLEEEQLRGQGTICRHYTVRGEASGFNLQRDGIPQVCAKFIKIVQIYETK